MRSHQQSMQNKNQFAPASIKPRFNKNKQSRKKRSVSSVSSEPKPKYHDSKFLPPINLKYEDHNDEHVAQTSQLDFVG